MKILAPLALSLALASCNSLTDRVDWVDYGDDPMQNPQYMADMLAAGATGPQHEVLASRAGSWSVEGKIWMAPGAEPLPMNATARTEVLLGGRTIIEEFKSDFMGMPFEGRLIQGYDNLAQQYWSLWTDSMSTGYGISHGTETSPGHVEFLGTANDLLTPKGRPVRMTTADNGDGSYTMKMFDTREGSGEFQSMELRYTRETPEVETSEVETPEFQKPEIKTLEFQTEIAAPVEKVWEVMFSQDGYTQWTAPFTAGSYFEGSWSEGERMHFLAPPGNGMVAEIAANRLHEYVSIKHLGFVINGVEDTTSDAVRSWAPAYENYRFATTPGGTLVTIEHEVFASFADYMQTVWPKALAALESLCEEN